MLNNKAILVRFSVSQWTAQKFDKKATAEVEQNHNVNGEVGRFNKQLASKKYLAELSSNISAARKFHYQQTLPWLDADAIRILPVANFVRYQEGMAEFHAKHEAALDRFVQVYPDVIDEARYRLNGLFNPEEFPALSAIRGKFAWETSFSPVPDAGDFRVDLGNEVMDQMRTSMEQRIAANYNAGMLDLFERVADQATHVATSLREYTGTRKGRFNDSLVEKTIELASILPKLNVANDERLNDIARRIDEELCALGPDVLRENDYARVDVAECAQKIADEANEVINQMRGLFA